MSKLEEIKATMLQLMGEATAAAEYSSRVVKTTYDVLEKIRILEKDMKKQDAQNKASLNELTSLKRQLTAKTKQSNVLRRQIEDLKACKERQEITLSSDEDFNKTLASLDAYHTLDSPKKETEEAERPIDSIPSSQEDQEHK